MCEVRTEPGAPARRRGVQELAAGTRYVVGTPVLRALLLLLAVSAPCECRSLS